MLEKSKKEYGRSMKVYGCGLEEIRLPLNPFLPGSS
jgi:hypothetical protein